MITVVFIGPFAVFRLLQGNLPAAVLDAILVAAGASAAVHAWRTGRTRGPGITMSVVLTAAAALVPVFLGLDGAVWIFPIALFVFYLVVPWIALVMVLAVLLSYVLFEVWSPGMVFTGASQMVSFLSAGAATAIFSYFFARQAGQQRDQLVRWATKDTLTGLFNRRNLDEELRIALAGRDRHDIPHALIILDLDNFKEVNDRWGHAEGDRVLVELANLIRSSTRAGDRAFRYGGDEFVILLPSTDCDGVQGFAANLVRTVSGVLRAGGYPVTVSVGAAVLSEHDTAETWNRSADRALYAAKQGGRNRAVVAGPGAGMDRELIDVSGPDVPSPDRPASALGPSVPDRLVGS